MVSRRRILSRSRDDLNNIYHSFVHEDEDDVWYQKEKLFRVSTLKDKKVNELENQSSYQIQMAMTWKIFF